MNTKRLAVRSSSTAEQVQFAREVLRSESRAIAGLAEQLDGEAFRQAIELVEHCAGHVVVTGMGKAGHVGRKIAATLASTGTPSHFLHPAEAVHGDLGSLGTRDVLLAFSFSGETEELVRLLASIQHWHVPLIAVTAHSASTLARQATVVLELGRLQEACPLGLAPSTTTTAMMALGDALALAVSRARGFQPQDFVRFHPGGSLGRKLTRVEQVARPLADCRIARQSETLRQVLISQSRPGRRTGAIMLIDDAGKLRGIFTDSDLARLVGQGREAEFDASIEHVMTVGPKCVVAGSDLEEALQLLEKFRISELPVVDADGRPVGLIDITDLIGTPGCRRVDTDSSVGVRPLRIHRPEPNDSGMRS